MDDPSPARWTDRKIDIAEKYLDRMLVKLDSAKADLEKNWLSQITSIAISLALVAGLGSAIANKLFDDPKSDDALYVVLPLVNTYFFIRFGLIAGVFSKARYNAEQLTNELLRQHKFPTTADATQIYRTNSYFEWAHESFDWTTISFLMTIPFVFALNHSVTLYLAYKVLGWSGWYLLCAALYLSAVTTCYLAYYFSNKSNTVVLVGERKNSFIVVVIVTAGLATAAMIWALVRLDADPRRIDFKAASRANPARSAGRSSAASTTKASDSRRLDKRPPIAGVS
jgi:hypothetical protein